MMTEEEKVNHINKAAAAALGDWIAKIDDGEAKETDLLAAVYGGMVAAYLLGYNLENMLNDAKAGGDRLMKALEETENSVASPTCPNKDEDDSCPLHNLHCQYPECEKSTG